MRCNHCMRRRADPRDGLCLACRFECPERSLDYRPAPLPAEPTDALPGSRQKVEVLQERAGQRVALFHPADACISLWTVLPLAMLYKLMERKHRGANHFNGVHRRNVAHHRRGFA